MRESEREGMEESGGRKSSSSCLETPDPACEVGRRLSFAASTDPAVREKRLRARTSRRVFVEAANRAGQPGGFGRSTATWLTRPE